MNNIRHRALHLFRCNETGSPVMTSDESLFSINPACLNMMFSEGKDNRTDKGVYIHLPEGECFLLHTQRTSKNHLTGTSVWLGCLAGSSSVFACISACGLSDWKDKPSVSGSIHINKRAYHFISKTGTQAISWSCLPNKKWTGSKGRSTARRAKNNNAPCVNLLFTYDNTLASRYTDGISGIKAKLANIITVINICLDKYHIPMQVDYALVQDNVAGNAINIQHLRQAKLLPRVSMSDSAENARRTASELRKNMGADMIIFLQGDPWGHSFGESVNDSHFLLRGWEMLGKSVSAMDIFHISPTQMSEEDTLIQLYRHIKVSLPQLFEKSKPTPVMAASRLSGCQALFDGRMLLTDRYIPFCEQHRTTVLASLPVLAAEIAGMCGFRVMFDLVSVHGGKRVYLPVSTQSFRRAFGINLDDESYDSLRQLSADAGQIELPSVWGVFMAMRRAAILVSIAQGMSINDLIVNFGVTERHIRTLRKQCHTMN